MLIPSGPNDALPLLRERPEIARLLTFAPKVQLEMLHHEDYREKLEEAFNAGVAVTAAAEPDLVVDTLRSLALAMNTPWTLPDVARAAPRWLADLQGASHDILEAAARDWRLGHETAMPTPGQFVRVLTPYMQRRKTLLQHMRDLMSAHDESLLTDEEEGEPEEPAGPKPKPAAENPKRRPKP